MRELLNRFDMEKWATTVDSIQVDLTELFDEVCSSQCLNSHFMEFMDKLLHQGVKSAEVPGCTDESNSIRTVFEDQ